MPITSATFQITTAATAYELLGGATTQTGNTSKRDTYTFTNGTGSCCITSVVDVNLTVAANSTVTALSSLTNTLDSAHAGTMLKGYKIKTASTNVANVTITSNISGMWTGVATPNTTVAMATGFANGFTITGANNITVAGVNGDKVTMTLYLS